MYSPAVAFVFNIPICVLRGGTDMCTVPTHVYNNPGSNSNVSSDLWTSTLISISDGRGGGGGGGEPSHCKLSFEYGYEMCVPLPMC